MRDIDKRIEALAALMEAERAADETAEMLLEQQRAITSIFEKNGLTPPNWTTE